MCINLLHVLHIFFKKHCVTICMNCVITQSEAQMNGGHITDNNKLLVYPQLSLEAWGSRVQWKANDPVT